MKKKLGFANTFIYITLLSVIATVAIISTAWIVTGNNEFTENSKKLRIEYIDSQKEILKNEVNKVSDYINYMKTTTEQKLKIELKAKVYEGYSVIENLYKTYSGKKTDTELKKIIFDALKDIRFYNGRGYYFISDFDGNNYIMGGIKDYEGTNILNKKTIDGKNVIKEMTDYAKKGKEGYFTYSWPKPGINEKSFKKISYIKPFMPYGWYIGVGEYYEDFEKDIQKEVLERIAKIRFGKEGYIFVVSYDGVTLMNDTQRHLIGVNIWNLEDPNGVKVIQEERKAADKPEGDFIYYVWNKPSTKIAAPKISFVKGVNEWSWMFGAGLYVDDVENKIVENKKLLEKRNSEKVTLIIIISASIIIIVMIIQILISKRIKKIFKQFSSFFKEAEEKSIQLSDDKLIFTEFTSLADSVNVLLAKKEETEKELLKSKEDAENLNKSKSMFLANMSHELRTPLNGIVGLIEIMNMTELNPEQMTYIKDIEGCSNNLLGLINDILDISKIESGKIELETTEFDLEKLTENVINSFSMDFHKKGLEFGYYIDPSISKYIYADEGKIRQVMSNLLSNSKKFTDKGYVYVEISKTYEKNSLQLKFMIEDTGIGIKDDIINKLFQPFEQGDISYSKKYQGTGLGLSISKSLVQVMGGDIWFETEAGKGTKFYFTVNIRESSRVYTSFENIKYRLENLNILVIDDNRLNRIITEKMLSEFGIKVKTVSNGEEGMNQLKKFKGYDLILLDVNMPEADGITTAKKIKDEALQIPIVLFTSVDFIEQNKLKELEIRSSIVKPVKKKELVEKIIDAINVNIYEQVKIHISEKKEINETIKANKTIMVVEDNDINMKNITFFLNIWGYDIIQAVNGKEATNYLLDKDVDLIFMDLQMPVMNGFEATKFIRQKELNSHRRTPIIALTAYARKEDEERCMEAGMDDFISKPAKSETIMEKLKKFLG